MLIVLTLLKAIVTFGALALCYNPRHVIRDSPPQSSHPAAAFNATILDQNGTDITSSFEIRLFQAPPLEKALTNLTDRSVGPMRIMNFCPKVDEVFISSHCQPSNTALSMQLYASVCREDVGPPWPHPDGRSRYNHHSHFCDMDEICVTLTKPNWRTDGRPSMPPVAACVDQTAYRTWRALEGWGYDGGDEPEWVQALHYAGMKITTVASKMDGLTGLEMGSLGIEAEKGGVEVEKESCKDCLKVGTSKLPVGTDSLGLEATVVTAATGAMMGVLWVAVLSG